MGWLKGSFSICYMLAHTIVVCMPLYAMALLRLLLSGSWHRALTRRMDLAIDFWVSCNRLLIRALGLTKVDIEWPSDRLTRSQWYVVVSNHQSWADILLLQDAFRTVIPPLKFFTKRELIWLPLAGPAMKFLGFPYVRRLSKSQLAADPTLKHADRDSTIDACAGFRNHPTSVLIFLEGTRFTQAKRSALNSRFDHLLNPRTGGLGYVLGGLREELEQLIDVTIVYPQGPPSFWEFLQGKCSTARMTVRVVDLAPAMHSAEQTDRRQALISMVEGLWREKDETLRLTAPS